MEVENPPVQSTPLPPPAADPDTTTTTSQSAPLPHDDTHASLFSSVEARDAVVSELSEGFLHTLNTPLEEICSKLLELRQSQEELIGTLEVEREKLQTMPFLQDVMETMNKVGPYYQKAQNIKKDMGALSERVNKLKKRAEKLQAKKEADLLAAAERERQRQEREKQLTAQPSPQLREKEQKGDEGVKKEEKGEEVAKKKKKEEEDKGEGKKQGEQQEQQEQEQEQEQEEKEEVEEEGGGGEEGEATEEKKDSSSTFGSFSFLKTSAFRKKKS